MKAKLRKFLRILGPGFITGASDDDPSGIATYSQTGAQFGYSQLWTALFSLPFMAGIQEICGRIGLVTGKGIAKVIREHYGRTILYGVVALLFAANTVNIGADLGAMAASMQLLVRVPFPVLLIGIAALTLLLEIFISYKTYAKFLKYLTLSLFAYVITAFVVRQAWGDVVAATFVPRIVLSKDYLLNITALLGTTISPYLFFWQANEEVEEEIARHRLHAKGAQAPIVTKRDVKRMRTDTILGMSFSNIITFFIILTAASALGAHGATNIQTASDAAGALRPLAGEFTFLLFTIGIIGTGLLAIPVLAGSASYALSESFGWRSGLYRKLKRAHGFYGAITIATLIGLLINFTSIPAFRMLYYAAALNGVIAPVLMVIIMLISKNKGIMGEYSNSRLANALGWSITAIMGIVAIALIASFFLG